MSKPNETQTANPATLYVKLAIGVLAYLTLAGFAYLHLTDPDVTVPYWMFAMLLTLIGTMLGVELYPPSRGRKP